MTAPKTAIEIGLSAAIVAVADNEPLILSTRGADGRAGLPFGPFDPLAHRTIETGLRAWVAEQTGLRLGYVEQLYTFGDRGRHKTMGDAGSHVVSVGYLALARAEAGCDSFAGAGAAWRRWYEFLPWEDWRGGKPALLDEVILPALSAWANEKTPDPRPVRLPPRHARLRLAFGVDGLPWDEERVLDRYELLYEAGLVEETAVDGRSTTPQLAVPLGVPMEFDHRRILATAIARLRGKLKYRPVIFELMPPEFTLTELQQAVEAIAGRHLHKQNFRRLVENAELVEPTGAMTTQSRGRPAALYRFRREILDERPAPGLRFGVRG